MSTGSFHRMKSHSQISRNAAGHKLDFESLEDRRVLATGVFNAVTETLTVDLDSGDTHVLFSHDGRLITLAGSVDMDPATRGDQTVKVADVSNITINGDRTLNQSLKMRATFEGLTNLSINNVTHVVFDGVYAMSGALTIVQADNAATLTGRIGNTIDSSIVVRGDTSFTAPHGNVEMDAGFVHLNGKLNLNSSFADGIHRLKSDNPVTLGTVQVDNTLRLEAPEILDHDDSVIRVHKAYLKSDSILIGESTTDFVDFDMLNVKSNGAVDVSDDSNIELIGSSFAQSMILSASDWISDAPLARTNITRLATFTAEQVTLGERQADEFNVGHLSFTTATHAHFSENSDMQVVGRNLAASADLRADGNIGNAALSSLLVTYQTSFQSTGDVTFGAADNDMFMTSTTSFEATTGHVHLNVNGAIHILNVNVADSLELIAEENITDDAGARTTITNHAGLTAADSIYLGDGESGFFETGSVTLYVTNQVILEHDAALMITGENHAGSLILISTRDISNAEQTHIEIVSGAEFRAMNVAIGQSANDTFNAGWVTFQGTGVVQIAEDSVMEVRNENFADQLHLNSVGKLFDAPAATTTVTGAAELTANSISFGRESTFSSQTLQFNSNRNTTIHQKGDLVLVGESTGNSIRLRTDGSISNRTSATVQATYLLDLIAASIALGSTANDVIDSSSLNFQSTGDIRLRLDSGVVLVHDNFARSIEIIAAGDVVDNADARTHLSGSARFAGVDVIIGDTEFDCLSVDSGQVLVEASGFQLVNFNDCL